MGIVMLPYVRRQHLERAPVELVCENNVFSKDYKSTDASLQLCKVVTVTLPVQPFAIDW